MIENDNGPLYLTREEALANVKLTLGSRHELLNGTSHKTLFLTYHPDRDPVALAIPEGTTLDTAAWSGAELWEACLFEYERQYVVRREVALAHRWVLYGGDEHVERDGETFYAPPASEILDMVWALWRIKYLSHRVNKEAEHLNRLRRECLLDSFGSVDG